MSHRRFSLPQTGFCAAALIAATALAGCGGLTTTATSVTSNPGAVISGAVHGGQQPISGATVTLWAAGNTGYGSAPQELDSAVTGSNGTFNFQNGYTCPSTTAPATYTQTLYLTATGGSPINQTSNTGSALLYVIGDCSTALANNPTVVINEVTTVAGMFALQQFFKPSVSGTGTFGTSSTNKVGLVNAVATMNNLMTTNGFSPASLTVNAPVSGYSSNPVITITPEQSKIYTMANILADCINRPQDCSTLFTAVNSTAALDTMQAAYYMATNPTSTVNGSSNIATIFGLSNADQEFVPALASAPTDWTIGVTYGSNSTQTAGSPYLIDYPTYLAVDSGGNVWIVNDASTSATGTTNSVTELSPNGTPMNQVLTGSTLIGPAGIAIDPSNNLYVPNFGSSSALQTSVVEYTSSGNVNKFTTNKGPQRLAIDGQGNVFVLEPSYKGLGDLEEISASSTTGSAATTIASGLTTDFSSLAIDSNYTIWVTGGGTGAQGGTSGYPYVYQFLYNSTAPNYPSTPSATTNVGGILEPEQSIAIDNSNDVWIANYGGSTISEINGTTSIAAVGASPYSTPSGLTKPEFSIIDGAGDVWLTNAVSPTGPVFEVSNTGAAISPSTGFAHTYFEPYGIALDPSGNVWLANYNSAPSATVQSFITEIVGQAAPVLTPLSAGLPSTPGLTSNVGKRP